MKKIIRRVVLCLLAVIVIGVSVVAYFLFGQKAPIDNGRVIVTDAKGQSYLAVVDEKSGETMVAMTDSSGNIVAAVTDKDGNVGATAANLNGVVDKNDLPTNYTGPSIDVSVNGSDYAGKVDTTASNNASSTAANATSTTQPNSENTTSGSDKEPTKNNNSQTTTKKNNDELTAYRIQEYQKIFAGGTFLMEFTNNDEEFGDTPVTMAIKNNDIYIETQIQSMACKMLYKSSAGKNGTTYLIIDDFKKYCKMPEDLMSGEDMDVSKLVGNFSKKIDRDITVSKVTVSGKELICESYVSADGTTVKYYFDGDTLVRRDDVAKDGTVTSTYISRITSDVPDSLFEIPKNYGYLNLSFLSGLAG